MGKVKLNHSEFTQLSSEILDEGKILRFTAHGSSMAPFIRDGDILTVEPVDHTLLRVGKIVFYRTEGDSLIAHRIVGIQEDSEGILLKVRGDVSPGSEDVITLDKILGLIVSVARRGKEIRMSEGTWQSLGSLWVYLYPFPFIAYRIIRKIRTIFSPQAAEN
jgi:hypothetical protein